MVKVLTYKKYIYKNLCDRSQPIYKKSVVLNPQNTLCADFKAHKRTDTYTISCHSNGANQSKGVTTENILVKLFTRSQKKQRVETWC